ncbi:MAG: MarR family winged helix-turn-helix transcriptional regulator [Pseudomonadota bacterium]|jgi:DNA-binding MarR family transcriptional regulator
MTEPTRTQGGQLLTDLMLDLFRLHGRVIASGDRLVADLGLTSARWQVLGAIAAAQRPQPVAWLARDLGANRQNIQRIVNDLEAAGLVAFAPNPHHRRAQLVVLTEEGRAAFEAAMRLQAPWVERLAEGLAVEELQTVHRVLVDLRLKLEGDGA